MTEIEILSDVLRGRDGDLSPDVARSILEWKFSSKATARINRLAALNSEGKLTDHEREELDRFLRIGSLINLVQADARRPPRMVKSN